MLGFSGVQRRQEESGEMGRAGLPGAESWSSPGTTDLEGPGGKIERI